MLSDTNVTQLIIINIMTAIIAVKAIPFQSNSSPGSEIEVY